MLYSRNTPVKKYILPSLQIAATTIKIKLYSYKLCPHKLRLHKLRLHKLRLYKLRLDKLRPHKLCLRKLRPTQAPRRLP